MRRPGVWLGNNERTEETIIGTAYGIVKCRTFNRMSRENRCDPNVILNIRGTPSELVPGRVDPRIPVAIDESGTRVEYEETKGPSRDDIGDETPESVKKPGHDKLHVSRKAMAKYGPTDGCAACIAISLRGHLPGKLGHNHNDECRQRILKEMEGDPQYRELLKKHKHGEEPQEIEAVYEGRVQELQGHLRKAIKWVERQVQGKCGTLQNQFDKTMMSLLINNIEVAEIYSLPRITKMARSMGFRAGWSLDLTTQDDDGRYWGFTDPVMTNRAASKVLQDKPMLLIGGPMCIVYSVMNNVNHARMFAEIVKQRFVEARKHLEFCTKLYNFQRDAGRSFVHEHPESAYSWQEECTMKLMSKEGVLKTTADQRRYGLKREDTNGKGLARKSTSFMTNPPCIARRLSRLCPNRKGVMVHKHVILQGGKTRAAQVYPPGLCRAICLGLKEQIHADRHGQFLLMSMDNKEENCKSIMKMAKQIEEKCKIVEDDDELEAEEAWDDVPGKALDPKQVRKARQEEIDYIHEMGLYVKVPIKECYERTGKSPIIVRWIDINNGGTDNPNYRPRFVAREINICKRDDLFAATPPLEALKTIIAMTATSNKGEIIMVNYISRAFFHAKAERDVFVQLPEEDKGENDEKLCGKLQYSMYGTRDAAKNWFHEYS